MSRKTAMSNSAASDTPRDDPVDETSTVRATAWGRSRRTAKVSEAVARELLEYILHEGLAPGTKLPSESAMLESFDVGRGSLREALRILEVYGLLSIRPGPGGGPVVEPIGPPQLARLLMFYLNVKGISYRDLQQSSRLLQAVMAGQAAQRRDPAQIATMRQALDVAAATEDAREYGAAIGQFHKALFDGPGGELLGLLYDALHQIVVMRVRRRISVQEAKESLDDHEDILASIVAGRVDEAATKAALHLEEIDDLYEKSLPGFLGETIAWS